ncbi:unnamed protein product [Didymodactylos carnosus]|uniref:IC97/Casc1 N-terminal domain-containing protein n=1 Tax=Didymodactylos carnosus TaxID=1234261 RepID=A0A8S2HL48_9BILA|nr:unnamed protein product [Didymodactylos carnosus]CAF3642250.1 unnamed protein product [Didymodactylos carnosus]
MDEHMKSYSHNRSKTTTPLKQNTALKADSTQSVRQSRLDAVAKSVSAEQYFNTVPTTHIVPTNVIKDTSVSVKNNEKSKAIESKGKQQIKKESSEAKSLKKHKKTLSPKKTFLKAVSLQSKDQTKKKSVKRKKLIGMITEGQGDASRVFLNPQSTTRNKQRRRRTSGKTGSSLSNSTSTTEIIAKFPDVEEQQSKTKIHRSASHSVQVMVKKDASPNQQTQSSTAQFVKTDAPTAKRKKSIRPKTSAVAKGGDSTLSDHGEATTSGERDIQFPTKTSKSKEESVDNSIVSKKKSKSPKQKKSNKKKHMKGLSTANSPSQTEQLTITELTPMSQDHIVVSASSASETKTDTLHTPKKQKNKEKRGRVKKKSGFAKKRDISKASTSTIRGNSIQLDVSTNLSPSSTWMATDDELDIAARKTKEQPKNSIVISSRTKVDRGKISNDDVKKSKSSKFKKAKKSKSPAEEARVKAEITEKERIENVKRITEEKASLAKEVNKLRRQELSEFYEFIKPLREEAHQIRIREREDFKTINDLEDILQFKWLKAIHDIMLKATDLQDMETNNFQYTTKNQNVTLCVWANLSHNPRVKSFTFDTFNFGFDLPKSLSLANIAIVGLFLEHDYYSERSLLSKCRTKAPEYEYDSIPEALIEEIPAEEDQNFPNESVFDTNLSLKLKKKDEADIMLSRNTTFEQATIITEEERTSSQRSATEFSTPQSPSNHDKLRNSTADQILKELADETVVDLRSYWPLLPLVKIDLTHIPPQPKKLQEWTIVPVDNNDILVSYLYPSDPMIAERFYEDFVNKNKSSDYSIKKDDDKSIKDTEDTLIDPSTTFDATMTENNSEIRKLFVVAASKNETPVLIKFKVPDNLFVIEKPVLGRWSSDKKQWRQDGYIDYQYMPDTRMISFKTYDFGTYALLNDRHAHMPFHSWKMYPKGIDHVNFTLYTQTFEITFEIKVRELT